MCLRQTNSPAMRIGSEEHKELFCRTFVDSFVAFEPPGLAWPDLDDLALARLRAIPIWAMALDTEASAGKMLAGFAKSEPDPLVRQALELQGYEEDRHGRLLQFMVDRYELGARVTEMPENPTRRAFIDFGYNECVDSFAGFGIFKLACDAKLLPEALTSIFTRVLVEEARHIVFFVNWVAWDRARRGYGSAPLQTFPALLGYIGAIARRAGMGAQFDGHAQAEPNADANLNLFADVMTGLTPEKFIRACLDENARYMRDFDPRLLRPRVIPSLARAALWSLPLIEKLRTPNNDAKPPVPAG